MFSDVKRYGIREPGERGASGVTIYLDLNNKSIADPGEPVTTSIVDYYFAPTVDETGDYSFTHLGHGTHTIREIVPGTMDATPLTAQVRSITLPSVAPPVANFANVFRANEIHGLVFHDTDFDGTPDPGELRSGLPGTQHRVPGVSHWSAGVRAGSQRFLRENTRSRRISGGELWEHSMLAMPQ